MLRSLYIKNYALIEEFSVSFDRGLNIITGETGAGKSIILGAFSLLIGERSSNDLIRKGADKAVVEAEFAIAGNPRLKQYLIESEIECESDALIIRREINAKGTSRGYINDSPASAQILKELGGYLVDLHGQHEHQSLLKTEHHIVLLDEYGALSDRVQEYQQVRAGLLKIEREIEELQSREARLHEEHDLFEFQLQEILAVDPKENEDEKLESELHILENSEELRELAEEAHKLLYTEDDSIYEKLGNARELFVKLQKIDSAITEQLNEINASLSIVQELSKFLDGYADEIDLDSNELGMMRTRAQQIQRLKKKYGGSLQSVLDKKSELQDKLSFEESFHGIIEQKLNESASIRSSLGNLAGELSEARKTLARRLEPAIVKILSELGIEESSFKVQFDERILETASGGKGIPVSGRNVAANTRGIDEIEFYISTNAGEAPKPLARVASGGEISRIMLALKTMLAQNDSLPLLVFDEIDAGISGRIAQRVGRAMKKLTAQHQLIAITHLAQIAAFADEHFVVEKQTIAGNTVSRLRPLSEKEHIEEVARLISGDTLSGSSLENAHALIIEANQQGPVSSKPPKSKTKMSAT